MVIHQSCHKTFNNRLDGVTVFTIELMPMTRTMLYSFGHYSHMNTYVRNMPYASNFTNKQLQNGMDVILSNIYEQEPHKLV